MRHPSEGSVRYRWLFLLMMMACADLCVAAVPSISVVRLPAAQRADLLRLACPGEGAASGAEITAWKTAGERPVTSALAACAPHERYKAQPVRYVAQCERRASVWSCSERFLEVTLDVRGRELAVRPGPFSKEFAELTVQRAVQAVRFQGVKMDDFLQSPCSLLQRENGELVYMSCGSGLTLALSRWCPQSACPRLMYFADFYTGLSVVPPKP